jgi:homocysteine S-methyltransferase
VYRNALPQLSGQVFLTNSGLETDLIFNEGFDLPEFASFVLGRADRLPCGELRRVNQAAVDLLSRVQGGYLDSAGSPVVLSGCIGPRADAYRPGESMGEGEAEDYHVEQIEILAATDVDPVHAMTITYAAEAIAAVDAATGPRPVYYGVNCAHPSHFEPALPGDAVGARIQSIRANASRKSHAELDESPVLGAPDNSKKRMGRQDRVEFGIENGAKVDTMLPPS